jgi:hypothetical protein
MVIKPTTTIKAAFRGKFYPLTNPHIFTTADKTNTKEKKHKHKQQVF